VQLEYVFWNSWVPHSSNWKAKDSVSSRFRESPVLGNLAGTIHIEKEIRASVARVYRAFGQAKALKAWYDPRCRIERFAVGGKLVGDNYPSAEILALIPNHTIVHRYGDIVSGLGVWSFVQKSGGNNTWLIFNHFDAYDNREERDSITFYWKGLIENLAAFCESREIPFDHDAGDYRKGMEPRARDA
jgi:uncharacterized protein YndB with AHSA1/START domain